MNTVEDRPPSGRPFLPNPARLQQARSADEIISVVGPCLAEHRLEVLNAGTEVVADVCALDLGDCGIVSVKYDADVDIDAGCIADFYMVKLTVEGIGQITSGRHVATTRPGSIFITSPRSATRFRMNAACRHLTTRVSRRTLEEHLAQKLGRGLIRPLQFEPEIASCTEFGQAWWQFTSHLCELSNVAPRVLATEELRAQYSRTIIEMLLECAPHNHSEALHEATSDISPRHVRRAQEYIEAHIAEVHSVTDVARALGVSARTLQLRFKEALNVSPVEYLRAARVQALHKALLSADGSQSVSSLMTSVGIRSFGRFAAYYERQIGVSPSLTLRRGA